MQVFATLLIALTILSAGVDCDCISYDVCYRNVLREIDFNCPYDGPGKPLNNENAAAIMARRCPDYFTDRKYFR